MSAHHPSAHRGASSATSVPISPHMVVIPEATKDPANPQEAALQRKYFYVASVLVILQVLGLITAISLWQTGNEAAAIVVLCVGYCSSDVLKMLGSFLQTAPPNLEIEVKFNELRYEFLELKYLILIQFACIYLQRAIVPDLWLFGVAASIFVTRAVIFIRSCWQLYKDNAVPNKYHLFMLMICTVCCICAQIGFFIAFAITYGTTTTVQSKLPVGALFVPILFGQIANIVMIVMTKNWEVAAEVRGTSV